MINLDNRDVLAIMKYNVTGSFRGEDVKDLNFNDILTAVLLFREGIKSGKNSISFDSKATEILVNSEVVSDELFDILTEDWFDTILSRSLLDSVLNGECSEEKLSRLMKLHGDIISNETLGKGIFTKEQELGHFKQYFSSFGRGWERGHYLKKFVLAGGKLPHYRYIEKDFIGPEYNVITEELLSLLNPEELQWVEQLKKDKS